MDCVRSSIQRGEFYMKCLTLPIQIANHNNCCESVSLISSELFLDKTYWQAPNLCHIPPWSIWCFDSSFSLSKFLISKASSPQFIHFFLYSSHDSSNKLRKGCFCWTYRKEQSKKLVRDSDKWIADTEVQNNNPKTKEPNTNPSH